MVRQTDLEYLWPQLTQNINAVFKKNYIFLLSRFSTSGENSVSAELERSNNTLYLHRFPVTFPWHLGTTYLTYPGAAQLLGFPPTWIYHVINLGKHGIEIYRAEASTSHALHSRQARMSPFMLMRYETCFLVSPPCSSVSEECSTIVYY